MKLSSVFAVACILVCLPAVDARAQTEVVFLPGASANDAFGKSVSAVGDVDGDGAGDFAIGAPLNDAIASNAGAVTVRSGRTGLVLHHWTGGGVNHALGVSIAAAGDVDGDGFGDVLVGANYWIGSNPGYVQLFSGASGLPLLTLNGPVGTGFGSAVAGGSDVSGDGIPDVLVGAPADSTAGNRAGAVHVFDGASGNSIRVHHGSGAFVSLGHSVLLQGDVDGDGLSEYAAGAPAQWFSGGSSSVRAFYGATGTPLWSTFAAWNDMYGWSLARLTDVTGDGIDDVLAGAPQDPGVGCGPCNGKGFVRLLDGLTGAQVFQVAGTSIYAGLGWSLTAVGDINGNGVEDFAVSQPSTEGCGNNTQPVQIREGADGTLLASIPIAGGAGSQFGWALASCDANGDGLRDLLCGTPCENAFAGATHVYTTVRAPTPYCAAQANSLGCTPHIATAGTPSATQLVAFRIKAFNVLNNKSGILFYGFKPQQVPFLGGQLCIATPISRTPGLSSGGNPPPNDCSGVFSLDFNERIRSGVDPQLIAGEEVFGQYWSRDTLGASGTNLTNAIAFYVNP